MPTLAAALADGLAMGDGRPWPRRVVGFDLWRALAERLAAGDWTLLGLWGDHDAVHMALLDEAAREVAVATHRCASGIFPSVGRLHPPAIRPERAIRDLFGLEPMGSPDPRPWLDHGVWGVRHPLGTPIGSAPLASQYPFLASEGEGLHQIAVGPVHAGIIEPGHFRFTVNGEAVVRLEERLGYAHKGVERLMPGASLERAAQLAGRISATARWPMPWPSPAPSRRRSNRRAAPRASGCAR